MSASVDPDHVPAAAGDPRIQALARRRWPQASSREPPDLSTVMRYVEAPQPYRPNPADDPSIFLAGGITDCPDWQADARRLLADAPVVVLNPRRVHYPGTAEAYERQVAWEFAHLALADLVLFWFPDSAPGAVQPIALFELGAVAAEAARAERRLVVGAAPDYVRRHDLTLQRQHRLPGLAVHDNLDSTVTAALTALALP